MKSPKRPQRRKQSLAEQLLNCTHTRGRGTTKIKKSNEDTIKSVPLKSRMEKHKLTLFHGSQDVNSRNRKSNKG